MIPMPYILVNIVFSVVSVVVFGTATAAILAQYGLAGFYLPARIRHHRVILFAAHGLVLIALTSLMLHFFGQTLRLPSVVANVLFWSGVVISMILLYGFMNRHWFLRMPKVGRRLLIGCLSILIPFIVANALIAAVVALFIIKAK